MKLAPPGLKDEFRRDGLVDESKAGPVWNGTLRFSEKRLIEPFQQIEPVVYSVNPHGDVFHENALDAWLHRIFSVMESTRHSYQVLTKRSWRQAVYVRTRYGGKVAPPNIAFGVSCERQQEADARIPLLLATPAATRFVTLYPVLGPFDLRRFFVSGAISAVLAGEEPERPAEPGWLRAVEEQCAVYGVRFIQSNVLVGTLAA